MLLENQDHARGSDHRYRFCNLTHVIHADGAAMSLTFKNFDMQQTGARYEGEKREDGCKLPGTEGHDRTNEARLCSEGGAGP